MSILDCMIDTIERQSLIDIKQNPEKEDEILKWKEEIIKRITETIDPSNNEQHPTPPYHLQIKS